MAQALLKTDLDGILPFISRGKVRELWKIDDHTLLFVATDRISAYDVILDNAIPQKGALLTMMSVHWFELLKRLLPDLKTHFITLELPQQLSHRPDLARSLSRRSMQVRKFKVLPIESIVRGYITGSAWSEYKRSGTVHGIGMPSGLQESERLAKPIWTPSTKAEQGDHDENISPQKAAHIIGTAYAQQMEALSLELYEHARDYALERGIIIADTKFEFGIDGSDDSIVLIDEVLTPDSSRFWPANKYKVGCGQDSLDKQYLRNWLTANNLKGKDGVEMPAEVVQKTFDGYRNAYEQLVGSKWDPALANEDA